MYNDNEYAQPGYETNYEYNPEQGSEFEMENSNEFNKVFANEYALNPEFNSGQNYEMQNEYEDEYEWPANKINVHDHRSSSGYRPAANAIRHSTNRPSSYHKPSVTTGRTIPQNWQQNRYNSNKSYGAFNRYRNYPWQNRGQNIFGNYQSPHRPHHYHNPAHYNAPFNYKNVNSGYIDQSSQYPPNGDSYGQPIPDQSGGDPGYILETIKNLSQQIAATNASVQAIQTSIASLSNNQAAGMPDGATNNSPTEAGKELEDYEYEMEGEMNEGNELNEMELAAELLGTNDELELDHFLGGLLGGNGPLGKLLKGVIKKALPIAGAAAGTFFGGPLGTAVGQKIGSAASGLFELELEGLSDEDQEFEVAKSIVRLANDAAAVLAQGNNTGDPNEDAKNALIQSATHNAPGLLVKKHYRGGNSRPEGRWHRRGNKIIIENTF